MEEIKKEVKQESGEDKELNDLFLIEPIKCFLKELKENDFQELIKCKEWSNLKLDKRTEDKYNKKSYEYYIVKFGRILANYINQHYEKDANSYYFTFPVDNTSILVEHNNHDQLRDVVMRRFRGYRTNKDSEDLVKLISYSFYGWCKENKLEEKLKKSFQLTKEENSEADITKALYDFFTGKRQYHSTDLNTDKKISADYILFGKIPSCSNNEEFKQFVNKIIGTRARKNWDIHSSVLEEIDYSKIESNEKASGKIKEIGKRILEEARKYPSYDYLYQGEHYSDLAELLRICTSYEEYDEKDSYTITIKLPIAQIIDKISEWFHKKAREYTYYSFLEIVGAFADTAAKSENHVIDLEAVIYRFRGVYDEALIESIYKDLKSENPNYIIRNKFSIKQYRLVFAGQARALFYNRRHVAPEQIINDIYYEFKKDIDVQDKKKHTDWQFDNLIYFSYTLFKKLDYSISIPLIELLCQYADDFTAENRVRQECAISVLTYLLFEQYSLPQHLRKRVFLCYGKSMYKIQHDCWKHIEETSTFYKKYALHSFQDACKLECANQPNFFFLYGYVSEKPNVKNLYDADYILNACAYIQKESWYGNTVDYDTLVNPLKELLDKIYSYLIKDSQKIIIEDKDVLKYVYSSNYLCYAINNLLQKKITLSLFSNKELLEIAVYTDFYTRYYNMAYNISNNHTEFLERFSNVYMINGSFRLISCRDFENSKIKLEEEKRVKYEQWMQVEKGRYKILLARLLSYTDFFDRLHDDTKKELYKSISNSLKTTKFLSYDNMSTDEKGYIDVKGQNLFLNKLFNNIEEGC